MSNFTSSFKRSRFVRRSKQRQGAQRQKLEGESDSLASVIRGTKSKQASLVNQAQRKIAVGKANDSYEMEADNVADKVVANSAPKGVQSKQEEAVQAKPLLQKQEEEATAQAKPLLQKQEEEEEEAQAKPLLQKQEEEEAVQAKPLLQKQEEEEAAQAKPLLQKQEEEEEMQAKHKTTKTPEQKVPEAMDQRLAARKGSGEKMAPNVQNFMQQQFQKDFSSVRIHTDAEAIAISQGMRAQAFALGKDIYFNQGKYQPESSQGKRLLAHELTHVVQQNSKLKKPMVAK